MLCFNAILRQTFRNLGLQSGLQPDFIVKTLFGESLVGNWRYFYSETGRTDNGDSMTDTCFIKAIA